MKYKITWSNIACIIHVDVDGRRYDFICMNESKTEAYPDGNLRVDIWDNFPLEVRAAVNKQFGVIFSLPVEKRAEYIANFQAFEIEVNQNEIN